MEEFSKLSDSIYFHDSAGVFVNLFIASELHWPEKGLRLRQQTRFPDEEATAFVFETERPIAMTLRLRIPWWATRGGRVRVNGTELSAFSSPSSYLTLTRTWKTGDRVELELPMGLSSEPMPDDAGLQAVMYGPLVLAGRLGSRGLTRENTYGAYDCELHGDPVPVSDVHADPKDVTSWVEPAPGGRLSFRTRKDPAQAIELVPLNRIFGERFAVYWRVHARQT